MFQAAIFFQTKIKCIVINRSFLKGNDGNYKSTKKFLAHRKNKAKRVFRKAMSPS